MAGPGQNLDWQGLLNETQELVSQDHHSYPRVNRSIPQLQQLAESLRVRTSSRLKTLDNQQAATRLLAQQGFDAPRLTQNISNLELHPTIQDVFAADSLDVNDYLEQVHEATILSALQQAQQDCDSTFERFMDFCTERDWDVQKKKLFSAAAPYQDAAGNGLYPSALGAGADLALAPSGNRMPPKETDYAVKVTQLNQAAVKSTSFDAAKEFGEVCSKFPDHPMAASMTKCWGLLRCMLGRSRSAPADRYAESLLVGAREWLEQQHVEYMRGQISRHRLQAERGGDIDEGREVQSFIAVKFRDEGPLDFQQFGGMDTSWIQVYFCIRNGWLDAAKKAADKATDITMPRLGNLSLRAFLEEWIRMGRKVSDQSASMLSKEAERQLRDKDNVKRYPKYRYMVLLYALLAKDNRVVDALLRDVSGGVLSTIEDYMWVKVNIVSSEAGPPPSATSSLGSVAAVVPFTLKDLHDELNRYPDRHYSKNGKEPLLYVTVLTLSLQLHRALDFLTGDPDCKMLVADAVHVAIALHHHRVLERLGGDDRAAAQQLGGAIYDYGQRWVRVDSSVALQYYMLAASAYGGSLERKGRLLRELLTESHDYGTLLGGGGALGAGGALKEVVPDDHERSMLLEAVAHDCYQAGQREEAVELYMAAGVPHHALAILNHQISELISDMVQQQQGPARSPAASTVAAMEQCIRRAQDAADKANTEVSRKEAQVFRHLITIRDLLAASWAGKHTQALQKLAELPFIPTDNRQPNRIKMCVREAAAMHSAVASRLQDVVAAAAQSIQAQYRSGSYASADLQQMLRAVMEFVTQLPFRIPNSVTDKLMQAAASMP